MLKGKKILVTGADGFIGSHLVETLIADGAQVKALVYYNSWESIGLLAEIKDIEKKCEIIKGDIRDPHFCLELVKGCEYVFHLAALIAIPYSYIAPSSYFETNVLGTVNMLEAAKRSSSLRRFVHTSTSETYGTALYSPMDEKHELQAQSPYAASKVGADKAVMSYYLSFKTPVSIVRPFNNFGPRQSTRAVIPTILTQLISPNSKNINLGLLTPVRDYTFVKDTAEAFVKIAISKKTEGESVNVGTGKGYSIGQIVKMSEKMLDISKLVVQESKRVRPQKSEVWKLICDNRKLQRLTGWSPKIDFLKGLRLTADWIKDNIYKFQPTRYGL